MGAIARICPWALGSLERPGWTKSPCSSLLQCSVYLSSVQLQTLLALLMSLIRSQHEQQRLVREQQQCFSWQRHQCLVRDQQQYLSWWRQSCLVWSSSSDTVGSSINVWSVSSNSILVGGDNCVRSGAAKVSQLAAASTSDLVAETEIEWLVASSVKVWS